MKKKLRKRTNYFTLMEIMIVVAIIGLLMAIVGPMAAKAFFKGKAAAAKMQLRAFESSIMDYQIDTGSYPKSLKDLLVNSGSKKWDGPYISKKSIPKDPWGNDYVYRIDPNIPQGYVIICYGADGAPGGTKKAKDITNND
jgi:general secretion pathway protein G